MESTTKASALLIISMILASMAAPILGCPYCGQPAPVHKHPKGKPKGHKGGKPIILPKPPISIPPITVPPIIKPPITVPPIVKPPITLPPITLPPVVKPPITLPPITVPPITVPPVVGPPATPKPCPSPPAPVTPVTPTPVTPVTPAPPTAATCPIDSLKLGACVDLLGGLVHIGLGDPVVNECCPVLGGLLELEAAVCLCTTLKIKLLNLNIFVPLALQLLLTCGKTPPPGFTCTL